MYQGFALEPIRFAPANPFHRKLMAMPVYVYV